MAAGGTMGLLCLMGLLILLHRRLTHPRIANVTRPGDKILLLWLLVTLLLGLPTIVVSAVHMDGHMKVPFMTWPQHLFTFRGDPASDIAYPPVLFKANLFMGLSLFSIFHLPPTHPVLMAFASRGHLAPPRP